MEAQNNPCVITAYNADRMNIPDYNLDPVNLVKYNIGEGEVKEFFKFDYVPEGPTWIAEPDLGANCFFYKTYEIEVMLKSDRSAVTNTFISFVEPISQTAPELKIDTIDTSLENKYYVKISSFLVLE